MLKRTIPLYALALAGGAFLLQWLDYQYAVRLFSTQIYIVILAVLFTGVGIWVGVRMTRGRQRDASEPNEQAIAFLGLSEREREVLALLADGCSNKEIAKRLFVSVSTVKTHLVHLYQKLDVSRRTQAVHKARSLNIIE